MITLYNSDETLCLSLCIFLSFFVKYEPNEQKTVVFTEIVVCDNMDTNHGAAGMLSEINTSSSAAKTTTR